MNCEVVDTNLLILTLFNNAVPNV